MPDKRFEVGVVHLTVGAMLALIDYDVSLLPLLERHQSGDWGEIDAEDKTANDLALRDKTRLLSSYAIATETCALRVWILTESDRSKTTVLLPEEY